MRRSGLEKIEVVGKGYSAARARSALRSAAEAEAIVAPLVSGERDHVFVLTAGQASQIDFVLAMMRGWQADRVSRVSIWTWAIADYELLAVETAAAECMAAGAELRFVIDRSCLDRRSALIGWLQDRFGMDCLRATVSHAKIATIATLSRKVCTIRGSMNLNFNPRNEQVDICTTREVYDVVRAAEDAIWSANAAIGGELLRFAACNERMHAAAGSVGGGRRAAALAPLSAGVAAWLDDDDA